MSELTAISQHLTHHPQHISIFMSLFYCLATNIKYLAYSELSLQQIMEALHPKLINTTLKDYLHVSTYLLLECNIPSMPDSERLFKRVKEIFLQIIQFYELNHPTAKTNCLNLFVKIRFADYQFDEADIKDPARYDQEIICHHLPLTLIGSERYQEALFHLPQIFINDVILFISYVPEFCTLLAAEKPDWIREQYKNHPQLVLENQILTIEYYGIDKLDRLIKYGEDKSVARYIYIECSLESIELMLSQLSYPALFRQFHRFL